MKSLLVSCCLLSATVAQRQTLTVAAGGGNKSSPLLYGSLYEVSYVCQFSTRVASMAPSGTDPKLTTQKDIYHSGDGGLYNELLNNRAFQGSSQNREASLTRTTDHWHAIGNVSLSVDQSTPVLSPQLPWSMRIDVPAGTTGTVGISNDGFWGFSVDPAKRYATSLRLRGAYTGSIRASFRSKISNEKLSSTSANIQSGNTWTTVNFPVFQPTLAPGNPNNTFVFTFDGATLAGKSIQVNLLSLFKQTYNNRPNGIREDLAHAYSGLKSTWIRLPGGNNLQGPGYGREWRWNETIGDLTSRPGHVGTWGNVDTDGFGILEQLQWAHDMGQTVILGMFAGLHIGGNLVPESDLQRFIDMGMEELEFLLGSTSTRLGALRASLGYPTPFSIEYIELGNEDYLNGGRDSYNGYRFPRFYNAIKAKYPDINIISSVIPAPLGIPGTWIDLHMYDNQEFFARQYDVFDHTDRNFPVIVGEYACIRAGGAGGPEIGSQTVGMALSEAIMLLGAERNSDVIRGTAYGALIKNYVEESNTVAVIKHTADQILRSTSYYVQKLFSEYHGEETVAVRTEFGLGIDPVFWSATKTGNTRYLKLINYYGPGSVVDVVFEGQFAKTAQVVTLSAASCDDSNKLPQLGGEATTVKTSSLVSENGRFTVAFGAPCEIKVLVA
ncbi:glycoside hydrolase superfamily [Boeremia exigua]|uniref:glycoside hydrolase superfamily n=1 Tax=Boeremia exigua TaxID=749465 RepID=UPI001E8EDFD4|nr:glycoside hydrolase superfamily [Boeremia exigua]KAH6643512.1 glycoside hydrolase superfamily [Boeremia exigua]